jgi:hypothetical protein
VVKVLALEDNQFYVRWRGCPQPTWEPAAGLRRCRKRVQEFLEPALQALQMELHHWSDSESESESDSGTTDSE